MTLSSGLRRHWKASLVVAVVAIIALVVGVPYLYIHVIEGKQPAALSLNDIPSPAASPAESSTAGGGTTKGSFDGTWTVTTGSAAGYRVNETLAGQNTTAVGRTSAVSGSITIVGTRVTAASFTVQMASVTSNRSQRDQQFDGRIMDTSQFPTGTFVLTTPIDLAKVPAIGKTVTVTATGNLTLHGTTRSVTFPISAKRTGNEIAAVGDIPITYGDYNIDNPSFGGFVSVGNTGTVEFLIIARKGP